MRSFTASALLALAAFTSAQDVNSSMEGVVATGTMGKTNPAEPTMQAGKGDSEARLVTVNSIDVSLLVCRKFFLTLSGLVYFRSKG